MGLCGMNNETIPDAETVLPKKPLPAHQGHLRLRAISDRYLQINLTRSCRPTTAASSI